MTDHGTATEAKISEILAACKRHGDRSIIGLAGVPGTGKSFVAAIAAQRFAEEPTRVREIQFHPSTSYEEFVEGMRINATGGVGHKPGLFLEWNQQAFDDPKHQYVLLIEELTRADVSAVLGELMTYVEYRDRGFTTVYSRRRVKIAKNLTILATYNPTDRSAIDLDTALLRRMRIIPFPPDVKQLAEMLKGRSLPGAVVEGLQKVFNDCADKFPDSFEHVMPFGHGVFADLQSEADLSKLWRQRLTYMIRRPLVQPHPFAKVIEAAYPWIDPGYKVS